MRTGHVDPRDPYRDVAPPTPCACLQPAPWVVVDDVRNICLGLLRRYAANPHRLRDRTPEAIDHALDVLYATGGAR